MTDKIIIDGIDVSECEFYCEEYCNLSNDRNERLPFAEKCTEYSDCCYKQLKRKKQECEKYKQALDEIEKQVKAMNNECFYDDICDCNNCDMKNGCSYYRKSNIINIINKAKEQ